MSKKFIKRVFRLCLPLSILCLTLSGANCLIFLGEPKTEEQITKDSVDELKLFFKVKGNFKNLSV